MTRPVGIMLSALVFAFAMSHAFRTVTPIMAEQLQSELGTSPSALGLFAGAFHLAFAAAQPVIGVALDRWGPRRTVLVAFALSVLGSLVAAAAPGTAVLIAGQVLIGIGCAPALLAAMVFTTRRYRQDDFARISGLIFGFGSLGMLITSTPLALVVEHVSWRAAFLVLGVLSAATWMAVFLLVDEEPVDASQNAESLSDALSGLGSMLFYRHSAGILCLAAITYAGIMALRGLWLGPLLTERHGLSVVEVGNVAFAATLVGVFSPIVFGYLDRGARRRRFMIIGCSLALAVSFAAISVGTPALADVALTIGTLFMSGFITLQYADLRAAYPPEQIGRALSMYTMAMFAGVAAMQWLTSVAASWGASNAIEPVAAAMITVAGLLVAGAIAFRVLPWPPGLRLSPEPKEPQSPL